MNYSKNKQLYKKKKLISMRNLKKKAWNVFSKWIRNRDNNTCITCGSKKNLQAGHYIHRNSLDFDEININCQCAGCNLYKSGALDKYAIYLEDKYGHGVLQDLQDKSHKVVKYTQQDLEDIIKKYSLFI